MFLDTCPTQFGFKKRHRTDMYIGFLKEFIEFYRSCNTSVFLTFLMLQKHNYDKIDHWRISNRLLNIHVPVFIIRNRILVYWYSRQKMFIRCGNSCSTKFRVTIGVKQGGILFPAFLNVYMNNLSVSLNHSGIGASLGGNLNNHLFHQGYNVFLIYVISMPLDTN